MKKASWVFTFLFAGLLVYAFAQVPPPTDSTSALSVHVSSRYQQRAEAETGIHSPTGAVLADYRGFALLAAAVLFFTVALGILFFFSNPPSFSSFFPSLSWLALGVFLALGVGGLSFSQGGNFLDYEIFTRWVSSSQARLDGALALLGGVFLSLAGLLLLWLRWVRSPEGSGGR